MLEGHVVETGRRAQVREAELLVEGILLHVGQGHFQLRPPAGRGGVEEVHRAAAEGGRQLVDHRQAGLAVTVLQLREIGRRPPDRLAQRFQGQAGLAPIVAEPLTEHQGIEDIGRHSDRKFATFSRQAQPLGMFDSTTSPFFSIIGAVTKPSNELTVTPHPDADRVLTPEATQFVADLHGRFDARRRDLLAARARRQARFDAGERPDFLPSTLEIRTGTWTVPEAPKPLLDRRVEITGPVERKMMINALNSGAQVFMADFEDACTPTWDNVIAGQVNLQDAVRGTIELVTADKTYRLAAETATLAVRPRGWHLVEKHFQVGGEPVSASLFDFGLHVFHNGRESLARGSGPYYYLPKMEGHQEARLWNDAMFWAEDTLGLDRGSIRATVLIETITAAFEMDEILYELRDHICALNAGRWDYIFSVAKRFHADPAFVLPDRSAVTMTVPVHARLHRTAGEDLPPARRPRHRRHGRLHPEPPQARGDGGGPGQGDRRQAPRGRGRLRRHLGGPSRTWSSPPGPSSTPSSATAPTSSSASARTSRWGRPTCSTCTGRPTGSPGPGSTPTSRSACAT